MSAKKRRPGAVTPERQTNKGPVTPPNSCPHVDCSTVSADVQGRVSRFLRHGAENAITTFELVQLVGCDTVRQLQDLIREERNGGCLILSTSGGRGGYFLPSTDPKTARKEIQRFVSTVYARALNTIRMSYPARIALQKLEGQFSIDDYGEGKPERVGGGPVG